MQSPHHFCCSYAFVLASDKTARRTICGFYPDNLLLPRHLPRCYPDNLSLPRYLPMCYPDNLSLPRYLPRCYPDKKPKVDVELVFKGVISFLDIVRRELHFNIVQYSVTQRKLDPKPIPAPSVRHNSAYRPQAVNTKQEIITVHGANFQ